ncbi:MAG: 50S ribosomal protein L17 [Deltaproteobacteria bacterium]|nr:50S ribosomal protein L17 [Deltaproteobacteria bacterium]
MRHHNAGRKFDRNTSSRRAMFRNLAANLVLCERIETTDAKAKELRRVAERLITKARRLGKVAYTPAEKLSDADKAKRLATKRLLGAFLPRWGTFEKAGETKKVDLVEKVLIDLAKRFEDRPGGYTRIVKLGPRRGDNAPMAIIELLPAADGDKAEGGEKKSKKKAAKPKAEKAEAAAG